MLKNTSDRLILKDIFDKTLFSQEQFYGHNTTKKSAYPHPRSKTLHHKKFIVDDTPYNSNLRYQKPPKFNLKIPKKRSKDTK